MKANEPVRQLFFGGFLADNTEEYQEFRLVAWKSKTTHLIEFYIHPMGKDGTTFDGYVSPDSGRVCEKHSFD